jgi:hypothetical protein
VTRNACTLKNRMRWLLRGLSGPLLSREVAGAPSRTHESTSQVQRRIKLEIHVLQVDGRRPRSDPRAAGFDIPPQKITHGRLAAGRIGYSKRLGSFNVGSASSGNQTLGMIGFDFVWRPGRCLEPNSRRGVAFGDFEPGLNLTSL